MLGRIKPEFGKRCKICLNVMQIRHEIDTEKSGGISRGHARVNGGKSVLEGKDEVLGGRTTTRPPPWGSWAGF